MDLLKTLIKEIETLLPSYVGNIFIDKLPSKSQGTGILFSEKTTTPQAPAFNDMTTSYQKRNVTIYVYSGTNDLLEGRKTAYNIYEALRGHPTITNDIDGVIPETPIYFGETGNQKHVHVLQMSCYYHKQ